MGLFGFWCSFEVWGLGMSGLGLWFVFGVWGLGFLCPLGAGHNFSGIAEPIGLLPVQKMWRSDAWVLC